MEPSAASSEGPLINAASVRSVLVASFVVLGGCSRGGSGEGASTRDGGAADAGRAGDASPASDAGRTRDAGRTVEAGPSTDASADPLCPVHVVFPADSGAINIQTAYGAKGDGVTDDTAAILKAIQDNIQPVSKLNENVLYFPNGTYLVSDTLPWKTATGAWGSFLTFEGECQRKTR